MRISDWSSDVCSSDLSEGLHRGDVEVDRPATNPVSVGVADDDPTVARQEWPEEDERGPHLHRRLARDEQPQIGRASGRERVCQYVSISVVAVSLKKKKKKRTQNTSYQENNKQI